MLGIILCYRVVLVCVSVLPSLVVFIPFPVFGKVYICFYKIIIVYSLVRGIIVLTLHILSWVFIHGFPGLILDDIICDQ